MGVLTRTIIAALFVAATFFGSPAQAGGSEGFALREVNRKSPGLDLDGIDGKEYSLVDYEGRVVLLHFWASWCEPCRVEMPALIRLAGELGDEGLTILLVAEDSLKNARAYAEEHGLKLPVLVDQYGKVMRAYGIKAIPSSVVIGRDGRIKAYLVGQRDYAGPAARRFFGRLLEAGP